MRSRARAGWQHADCFRHAVPCAGASDEQERQLRPDQGLHHIAYLGGPPNVFVVHPSAA